MAAVRDAAVLCESLGHRVEEATVEFDAEPMLRAFSIIWSVGLRGAVEGLSLFTGRKPSDDTLEPHVMAAYRDAGANSATEMLWALEQMNTVSRAYGRLYERYDVMLTPAGSMVPFEIGRIGQIRTDTFYEWFLEMCAHCPFLSTANIAGIPAMSVPLAWSTDDLPIGIHFLAGLGQEVTLLKLAAQLEAARPWIGRRPAHHVANLADLRN